MSEDQKPQWGCAAYGCIMHGSIKDGEMWVCHVHFGQSVGDWQEISSRLNFRREIVRYYQHALRMDPFEFATGRSARAGEALARIGRPDLAPREVTLEHKTRDKITGEERMLEVRKDERVSKALWINRLASALKDECAGDLKKADKHQGPKEAKDTWATAAGLMGAQYKGEGK